MSRTRSRSDVVTGLPVQFEWAQRAYPGGSWITYPPTSPSSAAWNGKWSDVLDTQTMTDQKTPGYFRAVREGSTIPVSPMSSFKRVWSLLPGGGELVHRSASSEYRVTYSGYLRGSLVEAAAPAVPSVDPDIPLQEALSRAQTDAWDVLTFMAEFRSTLELFIGLRGRWERLFDRLASKVISRLRRGKIDRATAIAEAWVELRYAWRPLYYDMLAMNEALQRLGDGVDEPIRRAWATREGSSSNSAVLRNTTIQGPNGLGGIASFDMITNCQTVTTVTAHAAVAIRVRTTDALMVDPLVTAWELVTWSFVFDWFVTVGSMLSAFSPWAAGSVLWSTVSLKTETQYVSTYQLGRTPGYTHVSGEMTPASRYKTDTSYERLLRNPTPTLAIDVNLDSLKILDLLALWMTRNQKMLTRLLRHT